MTTGSEAPGAALPLALKRRELTTRRAPAAAATAAGASALRTLPHMALE